MTIFERIIAREIPATVVYEDSELIAIRDIEPKAPVHILVIPKRPIPSTNDLTADDEALVGRMVLRAAKIAEAEGIAAGGYRLVMNCGSDGGQSVDHLHLHLLG